MWERRGGGLTLPRRGGEQTVVPTQFSAATAVHLARHRMSSLQVSRGDEQTVPTQLAAAAAVHLARRRMHFLREGRARRGLRHN